MHVTAEESGIQAVRKELDEFVQAAGLSSLKEPLTAAPEEFFRLTEAGIEKSDSENEVLLASSQVGFAAQCTQSAPFGSKEAALEEICTHWLSNTLLWEKLRTIGGAYGAFCYTEALANLLVFSTYRDPTPEKSADAFNDCLEEASAMLMDRETVERAVTGTYSSNIQPRSPHSRGSTGLLRTLYGIFDEDREKKIKNLLSATPEEVRDAFRRLAGYVKKGAHRSLITGKADGQKSVIVLPV